MSATELEYQIAERRVVRKLAVKHVPRCLGSGKHHAFMRSIYDEYVKHMVASKKHQEQFIIIDEWDYLCDTTRTSNTVKDGSKNIINRIQATVPLVNGHVNSQASKSVLHVKPKT